ncbi:MAG: ScyD/ScyE family protein [Thermogemmatispora sp.]|uniref:ScyD/ScyE family protein n=1 Tax=Thermogemmatispora sp. TaxID=1968838 RepID=UPI001A0725F9|nr:ScyD/ScyE family protein [Thermogemmatispora sp.]MBE3567169.1 ScyD/ScyE family protein [Thermogemmatispora sp.]
MNATRLRKLLVWAVAIGLIVPASLVVAPPRARALPQAEPIGKISIFATGLNNPRGLHFGPDGQLYVAEGGLGGKQSTVGRCQQVPSPIGPYTGGFSARISRIDRHGKRVTLIDHLPSSQTSPASGGEISGVSDLSFIGHTLYGLLAGAGCSHGVPQVPNAIFRFEPERHRVVYIANLSHFLQTHPVKHPEPEDFEPDGTWYSMVAVDGSLYALEPNHGELDRITPRWQHDRHAGSEIQRVADISASQGHIVPTAVAFRRGLFYVANLGTFPVHVGTEKLLVITPRGHVRVLMSGLTAVVGLAFDWRGRLYVLETTTANNAGPVPGTGVIVRVSERGRQVLVASGLSFPTAMTFGPDGDLYVSNKGYGYAPGQGEILRIHLPEH